MILIHVTSPVAADGNIWGVLINQAFRFAVPVFFLLSGWGMAITNSYEKNTNYIEFSHKKFNKIIPAYFIWNVIYILWIYIIYTNLMFILVSTFSIGITICQKIFMNYVKGKL